MFYLFRLLIVKVLKFMQCRTFLLKLTCQLVVFYHVVYNDCERVSFVVD